MPAVIVASSPSPNTGRSFASFSAVEPQVGRHEVVEEAAFVRRRQLAVASRGPLILLGAADAPPLRRDRLVLAHREPGSRLGVPRDGRDDLAGSQARDQAQPRRVRLRAVEVEEQPTQVVVYLDRRVRGSVEATGDASLDLPEGDLVGDVDRRLEARAARLLDVVGRRLRRERRAQHALPREVEVTRALQDPAGRDLAEALPREAEPAYEPVEGRRQHVQVRRLSVRTVAARERDPVAAQHGDGPRLRRRQQRAARALAWVYPKHFEQTVRLWQLA